MHYVRFLKLPRIEDSSSRHYVKALVCVTTDLGDNFYYNFVDVTIYVWSGSPGDTRKIVARETRAAAIHVDIPAALARASDLAIAVIPSDTADVPRLVSHGGVISMPRVLGVNAHVTWGRSVNDKDDVSPRHVLRRVPMLKGHLLDVWEESGESIARHIWDAGAALAVTLQGLLDKSNVDDAANENSSGLAGLSKLTHYLHHASQRIKSADKLPSSNTIFSTAPKTPFRVIELGAGCGIAGLSLARAFPGAQVLFTDLEDAGELLERNIAHFKQMHKHLHSSLSFHILDWAQPSEAIIAQPYDLILASDVTYNPDTHEALVDILTRLFRTSVSANPDVRAVVALKWRHDAERAFLQRMADVRFRVNTQDARLVRSEYIRIQQADDAEEYGDGGEEDEAEDVHVYVFGVEFTT